MTLRRHPTPLWKQADLLLILGAVTADLILTIYGIQTGQGSEANPLYRPFTSALPLMLAGTALYYTLLLLLGAVLTGTIRHILGSTAFGMHLAGTATWLGLLLPVDFLNVFWFTLLAAGGAALFSAALYRA